MIIKNKIISLALLLVTLTCSILLTLNSASAIDYSFNKQFEQGSEARKKADSIIGHLDSLYTQDQFQEISDFITSNQNQFSMMVISEWLRYKAVLGDARYCFLYMATLVNMTRLADMPVNDKLMLKDTAAMMYFLGKILIITNGQRCQDSIIPYPTILKELSGEYSSFVYDHWAALSDTKKANIINNVLKIEKGLKSRKPQPWICQRSSEAMTRYFEKDPNCEKCATQNTPNGTVINVPTFDNNDVKFKDDKEWLALREMTLNEFKKSFKDFLKSYQ